MNGVRVEYAIEHERIENFGVGDIPSKQSQEKLPSKCYKPCNTALLVMF